jgi:predicted chitinase
MQPVREAYWLDKPDVARGDRVRAANATIKRYFPYYGRGYVQLTWDYNYVKATKYFREVLKIDVDFVKNPDLVMVPEYAIIILFVGMKEGWFTGKSLYDYIDDLDEADSEDLREFANARRIINGTDKQVEIGKLGLIFERGLKAAGYNG